MNDITITGRVRGSVAFPEHPDHKGHWGLIGGEDVFAERSTFRSVGEAMTWCRKVLDGDLNPQWEAAGRVMQPRTEARWSDAEVIWSPRYGPDDARFATNGRDWHKQKPDGNLGDVVRTD